MPYQWEICPKTWSKIEEVCIYNKSMELAVYMENVVRNFSRLLLKAIIIHLD